MVENIKRITDNVPLLCKNLLIYIVSAFFIAISSQISIPMPNGVPLTFQTFVVAIIGFLFTTNKSLKIIFTYLFLGIIGIPVFSQGNFGIGALFGLTGGFLLGFTLFVLFCSKANKFNHIFSKIILGSLGLICLHLFGVLQYSILSGLSFYQSFLLVSLPFLLKDSLSIILALLICEKFFKKQL